MNNAHTRPSASLALAQALRHLPISALIERAAWLLREAYAATPAALALDSLSTRSPDERLRKRLLERLRHESSWRADAANVLVDDGRVTLQGLYARPVDRVRTLAIVRGWPGVREVRDMRVRAGEWQSLA
ncbi:MAG TPA: BON domain-containing protein [Burkholderiaceae bacterium]|nr:BON domain-containing protein [Burkholderiaceae bacterium]